MMTCITSEPSQSLNLHPSRMTIELERFIAKRELLDNFTHARVLTLRKSDNLLFEFAFGDELSHCVGNCLLYCPASSICDSAQRSQHFLIEVVDRPIANPKCDNVLRESFHVIPPALLSQQPQETFGEQFCDLKVTQFAPCAFARIVATFAQRIGRGQRLRLRWCRAAKRGNCSRNRRSHDCDA